MCIDISCIFIVLFGTARVGTPAAGTSMSIVHLQGDNNWGDDRSLYNKGQRWLHQEHIMGRVIG